MKQYSFILEAGYHDYNAEDLVDHETSSGIIRQGNKYLIQDHVKHNMLTFPVGKAKPNETPLDCLKTEFNEELGIRVTNAKKLFDFTKIYDFNGKKVKIKCHMFDVLSYTGKIENKEPEKHRWMKFMTLDEVKSSGRKISDCVSQYIKRGYDK